MPEEGQGAEVGLITRARVGAPQKRAVDREERGEGAHAAAARRSYPAKSSWRRIVRGCAEDMSLVHFLLPRGSPRHAIASMEPLHEQVIRLLWPYCEQCSALVA